VAVLLVLNVGDEGGGGTDSVDGVDFGASASVIFPCTIKSRRWQAMMEEVDKGCSEFCVTVVLHDSRYCDQDCRHTDP